jgi:hypothetical protein
MPTVRFSRLVSAHVILYCMLATQSIHLVSATLVSLLFDHLGHEPRTPWTFHLHVSSSEAQLVPPTILL